MTASDTESVISHLPALLTDLTRRGDDTDPDRFGRLRPSGRSVRPAQPLAGDRCAVLRASAPARRRCSALLFWRG
jgi:hypothetical protein